MVYTQGTILCVKMYRTCTVYQEFKLNKAGDYKQCKNTVFTKLGKEYYIGNATNV